MAGVFHGLSRGRGRDPSQVKLTAPSQAAGCLAVRTAGWALLPGVAVMVLDYWMGMESGGAHSSRRSQP